MVSGVGWLNKKRTSLSALASYINQQDCTGCTTVESSAVFYDLIILSRNIKMCNVTFFIITFS